MSGQEAVPAIRSGDVERLRALVRAEPGLVHERVDGVRTLLHVVTDWPAKLPNGPESAAVLLEAGADVNARAAAQHPETPLHWAASSDDVAVMEVLLRYGADVEAEGAVIGDGTPLADAVAFGQWNAARLLLAHGARVNLWQAAALGLMDEVERLCAAEPREITKAFWCACFGGALEPAQFLAARGADVNWVGYDHLTPLGAAQRRGAADVVAWLRTMDAR